METSETAMLQERYGKQRVKLYSHFAVPSSQLEHGIPILFRIKL